MTEQGKARRVVDNAIKYFRGHRDRMRYTEFIARGLPIGSGPVESAAKNIVQARLKRSGMRWSREGGQHVLDLRTYLKSERWAPMWNTLLEAALSCPNLNLHPPGLALTGLPATLEVS
jgi:hypothetical protein